MRPRPILITLLLTLAVGAGVATWVVSAVSRPTAPAVTDLERLGTYGEVPPFALTDQAGRRVTRADLLGHVSVVDFMYTECTDTCETISLRLSQLAREFAGARDLRLVSVSVDPHHDTPAVLARYAARYGGDPRWRFLTGADREIFCLATRGFHVSIGDLGAAEPIDCGATLSPGPAPAWAHSATTSIRHTTRVALVDRAGRIRAYHVGDEPASMNALAANLRRLLAETPGRR